MTGESQRGKGGVVLQLLRGEGNSPVPLEQGQKVPADEDVLPILDLDNEIKSLQLQIGQMETDLLKLAELKFEIYRDVIAKQAQQMAMVRKLATKVGIDTDSSANRWTLDLSQKVFTCRE